MTVPEPTPRRRFLRWMTALGAIGTGLLAGLPALRAFLSPLLQQARPADWVKLGEADLFDLDVPTKVDFSETMTDAWVETRELKSVWVFTSDGEHFTVYSGRCTHLGCSFAYDKDRKDFRCPCHRGVFDPKTGTVLDGPPPRPLDRLDTKIVKGDLYVAYQDFRVGTAEKVAV